MSLLLAREPELERLRASLEGALGGRAGLVFVTGEAGSGKSALLAEFVARARSAHDDLAVAVGVCDAQTGTADPYLPFREILAELTGARGADADGALKEVGEATQLARWIHASARALVEHAPDLVDIMVPGGAILTKLGTRAVQRFPWAQRLAEISGGRAERGRTAQLDGERICEQYTQLLRSIAREHPLVLVLDDLHWVDAASAGLMFHLARKLSEDRVLLVGAYRADDVALGRAGVRHPLESILNELQRYHGDVYVRLGEQPEAGRRFVQALLEAEAPGVDAEFTDELFRHTAGHPLFTLELMRHLQETGGLAQRADGSWRRTGGTDWSRLPARVEGVIAERAARLDERQREILTTASVEGQEFSAEVVGSVLTTEPRELIRILSGDLEKRHRLVVARGVERINGRRIAGYDFRHSLFHAWFYATLDPIERVYLHESVGRALETFYAGALDQVAGRLARHFLEADQPVEAIRYLLLAGDRARAAGANAEAAERYRLAASLLTDADVQLEDDLAREYAARIEEAFGVLAELAGDHDQASRHFDEALRQLERAPDDAFALLRGRIARRSAKPLEHQRRYPEAAARLDRAEQLLGTRSRDTREWNEEWLQIQLARVWVAYWRGETDIMRRAIETMTANLERWGRPEDHAGFYYCRALLGMRIERYLLSEATLADAIAAHEASLRGGQLAELALNEFGRGFSHLWRFELDAARHYLSSSAQNAQRAGDRVLEARNLVYLSVVARFAGDVHEALNWAERAEEVAQITNMEEYFVTVRAQRAWVAYRRGEHASALEQAETALRSWDSLPYRYPLRWLALLPLMAVHVAEQRFAEAATAAADMLPPPLARLREPVWQALQEAAADADPTRLRRAVALAQDAGYL